MTFNIIKSQQEIKKEILGNIIKMLINRGLINLEAEIDEHIMGNMYKHSMKYKIILEEVIKQNNVNEIYKIQLDNVINEYKVIEVKMNQLNMNEFLKSNTYKIVILDKFLQKSNKIYLKKNIEFFVKEELMFDYMELQFAPIECKIISNQSEIERICKEWNVEKHNLPKIYKTDTMARYFGMNVGNVVRIIRPNKQTAKEIYYRICIDE